jgi:uncharacterized protein YhfF
MLTPQQEAYWQAYLRTQPAAARRPDPFVEAWAFGDNAQLADELGALVVAGLKTATCSSLWSDELEGDPLPVVGDYSIVLDGEGEPLCIIETVDVQVRPFNEVDDDFAYAEGEDERTLASWRRGHWRFFTRTLAAHGLAPSESMPLVCKRFRVVYGLTTD